MVNTEIFSQKAIKNIPAVNKHICEKRPEPFGVDDSSLLPQIFERVNNHNDIPDKRKRVITKASHLFAGIIFVQPFKNGNKTTAEIITKYFLQQNGYKLPIRTEQDSLELIELEVSISP
ncbi:MAG: hypothetical protein MAG458_00280 [Nitrosopumilus sp.]|nr:hypothetical protein [Nitrosopumilus sp.]